jgi:hypothetical protein
VYLYRAVDKEGKTVDFLLSEKRPIKLFLNSSMDWRPKLAQNNSVLGLKIFLRQNLPPVMPKNNVYQ